MITNGDETVQFNRDDFADLAEKRIIDTGDKEIVEVPATLTISKVILDNRDRKWELVYQGNKINAKVVDDHFWQNVLAGIERFANGDKLVATLVITREYDQIIGAFLDKEYKVTDIRQHIPRDTREQIALID